MVKRLRSEQEPLITKLNRVVLGTLMGMIPLLTPLLWEKVPNLVLNIPFAIMFSMIISPQFRDFTASLDSTVILKNIYTALECPKWKNVIMEEMKAPEKNRTWEICALPKE